MGMECKQTKKHYNEKTLYKEKTLYNEKKKNSPCTTKPN